MSSPTESNVFCLVPLHDKVSVVENCLVLLEDIEQALQGKKDDINLLMDELSQIDVKTSRLIMHLRLNIRILRQEVCAVHNGNKR